MKNRKSLGQHWLKDRGLLDAIADLALLPASSSSSSSSPSPISPPPIPSSPSPTPKTAPKNLALCLEIGPGLGTLTSSLLKRFEKVLAVELDDRLAANLIKSFPGTNLTVKNCNFLDFDLTTLPKNYVAVGNIPYYITSPIIHKLLAAPRPPAKIVLLMQREVALRIVAADHKHSVLSLTVANFATADLAFNISANFFTTPPKVDSAVVVFTPHPPLYDHNTLAFIKHGFSAPRKKLLHNLAALYPKSTLISAFRALDIPIDARPADLNLDRWYQLFTQVSVSPISSL